MMKENNENRRLTKDEQKRLDRFETRTEELAREIRDLTGMYGRLK